MVCLTLRTAIATCTVRSALLSTYTSVDTHSHVTYYTELWRSYSWYHGYCYLLIHLHSLTHSTQHSVLNTTILSTTSYTCALTYGMSYPVYLCVLVSVGMCIPLWVYVLLFLLVYIA